MILVTGAGGKTGAAVIQALFGLGAPVRAMLRTDTHAERARRQGAQETIVGDLLSPTDLAQAVQGINAVYHICPNMHPQEERIGADLLAAAEEQSVARFVYHSVLHPQTEEMPHHWAKLRVEERLVRSRLAWTILQPAAYLQNILAYRREIEASGIYRVPYPVTTRLSMVDLLDVARVAARALTEPGHTGAVYELAGDETHTPQEIAAELTATLARPIAAAEVDREAWATNARDAGLGDYAVMTLSKMFAYYARYGFQGNGRVLTMLLQRPPVTLGEFLRREFTN